MSGDKATITPEDFQRYLTAKHMEKPCELCGHNEWQIPAPPEGEAHLALAGVPNYGLKKVFAAYPLFCGFCGNIKLIFAGNVEEWVADNG